MTVAVRAARFETRPACDECAPRATDPVRWLGADE
jgi:hypothetical protein